ncbi:MAG: peptidogalycan biosysnthesis protein, partial [Gammaproteobacteria bacterium]
MLIAIHASIDEIPAVGWNRLAGTQPFLQHEFLAALEHAGCVGGSTGWQPQHLTCTDDRGKLVGALPLYLKNHSWGEFVFDWAWAEAWQRAGRNYYPKLVAAVPFTPVTGSRLLVAPGAERSQIRAALINQAIALAAERQCSSIHCLFPEDAEISDWSGQGFLTREDCQFHWHNRDYQSFNDYLGTLTAQKRKKLKRERRRVREAGIGFRTRYGGELTSSELDALYTLYAATYLKRGHQPYL